MKKLLLSAFATLSLLSSGCSSVFSDVRATFDYALAKPQAAHLNETELAAFPYTALYASWADDPQIMLVLGFIDGQEFHWITGSRETVVTQHGRVVRTADIDYGIVDTSNLAADPLRCILQEDCTTRWQREASFVDAKNNMFSRVIDSQFEVAGRTQVELPMGTRDVYEVVERGHFALTNDGKERRAFTNYFWLEDDGHVVKSRQLLVPGRRALTLTQVKWIGRDE
ncbi:MAG: YjbF family lipoprotein [Idiomarina sp.]|nr:YjbF family lipoprotein [Idiomarina sp.]